MMEMHVKGIMGVMEMNRKAIMKETIAGLFQLPIGIEMLRGKRQRNRQ